MTFVELARACALWDGDKDAFEYIVEHACAIFGPDSLAAKFEVAVSTVKKWTTGAARPHPYLQVQIIEAIELSARRMMNEFETRSEEAVLWTDDKERTVAALRDGTIHITAQHWVEEDSRRKAGWYAWQDQGISLDEEAARRLRLLLCDWIK